MKNFLHERDDFPQLLNIVAREMQINDPSLVEKDYWIMHCLWSLKKSGLEIELKGGTSLSKGFGIIHRFSEDIDIKITADRNITQFDVYTGKNQDKPKYIDSRKKYFDWLTKFLKEKISGHNGITRDFNFDDQSGRFRNGGIRIHYDSKFTTLAGLKEGILLEVGFDNTAPNTSCDISSWAFDKANKVDVRNDIIDNRAIKVNCFRPEYTFVEKLQTITRKYRQFKDGNEFVLPANFIRHYYDVYQLLDVIEVQNFIKGEEYIRYKNERFGTKDDKNIPFNQAFKLEHADEFKIFEQEYKRTAALYFKNQPSLDLIIKKIRNFVEFL